MRHCYLYATVFHTAIKDRTAEECGTGKANLVSDRFGAVYDEFVNILQCLTAKQEYTYINKMVVLCET